MRHSRWAAAVLAAACVLSTGVPAAAAPVSYQVAGLDRPVSLLIDHWYVPHIYARSAADAFTAQGFNAARDRMFQLDLWLRHGLGRLSEVLGPGFVEQDKATRLFLYRGDIEREWAGYGPEAKLAATRFANGVNAYIDYLARSAASQAAALAQDGCAGGLRPVLAAGRRDGHV